MKTALFLPRTALTNYSNKNTGAHSTQFGSSVDYTFSQFKYKVKLHETTSVEKVYNKLSL